MMRKDGEKEWSKDGEFLRLWDTYSPLLTESRKEITDLYFNYDLSLGEIAEEKGVSRQSVSDCLKKSRAQLMEYEQKLGFCEATEKLKAGVSAWVEEQRKKHPDRESELLALLAIMKE